MSTRCAHSAIRLTLSLATLLAAATASAQVRDDTWATNGIVRAISALGNTIYIAGDFTQVGPAVGSGVAIDQTSGAPLTPYPRINGAVSCVASDGAGGWFVGGGFVSVQASNLAHIDANGNMTSWNPFPNGAVFSLLRVGSTLYVVGNFTSIMGALRPGAAAFDIATLMLTPWAPSSDGGFDQLAAGDGQIFVGGNFSEVGGQPRNLIAAVDPTTGACLPWTSSVAGTVLTASSGSLYVSSQNDLVRISETTGDVVMSIPTDGVVLTAVPDPASDRIYFGGLFTTVLGLPRQCLAAIDLVTGDLASWNPGADGEVSDLAVGSGLVVVAGNFANVGGQARPYLASVGSANGVVTAWNPRPNDRVLAVDTGNGTVYAGGYFSIMNVVSRLNAAAIDASTGAALQWSPNPDGEVLCMTTGSGKVYLGGRFKVVGGLTRIHFACVDALTGVPTAWIANMNSGDQNTPMTMLLFGNTLYTGGSFQIISGTLRKFLAALDASSGALLPFNPDPNSVVSTMWIVPGTDVSQPPTLYFGGSFTAVGGVTRNYLAAVDVTSGALRAWSPNANGSVSRLAVVLNQFGGIQSVYIGGSFTTMNGVTRRRAAAVDELGGLLGWNPDANSSVWTLSYAGSRVYLGGAFNTLGGQPVHYFAAVDATTGTPLYAPFVMTDGSTFSAVHAMLRFRSTIYLGGYFFAVEGKSSNYFAGLLDPTISAVAAETTPRAPSAVRAAPNPFEASTLARFSLPRAEDADVSVFDVAGRLVRHLHTGPLTAGTHTMEWEGSNDRGRAMPAGIYFLRIHTPTVNLAAKLHRLR